MTAPQPDFRGLGARVAREEDALLARPLSPDEAAFRGTTDRARRPRAIGWAAVAVAASFALVGGGAALVARARPLGLTVDGGAIARGGWICAPANTPVPLRFSEGTEITLDPEAQARVAEITRRGAHLLLESGTAHVSVTPNRGGQWTFTAGPFQVDVKGTRFEIAWSPREQVFSLKLAEGSVFISGCALGEGHPLFAGETLSASCLSREFHIDRVSATLPPDAPAVPAPSVAPVAPGPPPGLDPSELATRPAAHPPSARATRAAGGEETWQSLARAGRFKDAFTRVADRGFDAELGRAGRDDLLLLGDVARLSGDSGRALLAYQRVRSRAAGSEAAANAAFAMGRVYFDQREAYADAASWFATYRSERSDGPLARDATGRQMEALARAGDSVAATRVAAEYLRKYPQGPHAPLARTLHPEAN
jgi:transmembrane sensor